MWWSNFLTFKLMQLPQIYKLWLSSVVHWTCWSMMYFSLQVADPFYVFQFCSIILWSFDNYYYYAGAIFMVSFVSIVITIYQTRMVSKIWKLGDFHLIIPIYNSKNLVPAGISFGMGQVSLHYYCIMIKAILQHL